MPLVHNHAKQKLITGELSLGMGIRQARTVDIGRIARSCDFDWLFIDMEHNSMSLDTAAQLCIAAQDAGVTPLIRVPAHEHFHATRLLDTGAMGIVVPHIDNPVDADRVVKNCLFPPAGHRSLPGGLPQTNFKSLPVTELVREINETVLLVVMIETPAAVANVEGIAAIPGIDVLLMGGNDLSAELGIPGQFTHPKMHDAFTRIASACRQHNKFSGVGGMYDHAVMTHYINAGAQFILSGSDLSFLMAGAKIRSSFLRTLTPKL